jgi:hypothetical protein
MQVDGDDTKVSPSQAPLSSLLTKKIIQREENKK